MTKIIYGQYHTLEGIKDTLCNKLRIGQNCGSMCKNMVVMEMHCQHLNESARRFHLMLKRFAYIAGSVYSLLSYLFDSPVASRFKLVE